MTERNDKLDQRETESLRMQAEAEITKRATATAETYANQGVVSEDKIEEVKTYLLNYDPELLQWMSDNTVLDSSLYKALSMIGNKKDVYISIQEEPGLRRLGVEDKVFSKDLLTDIKASVLLRRHEHKEEDPVNWFRRKLAEGVIDEFERLRLPLPKTLVSMLEDSEAKSLASKMQVTNLIRSSLDKTDLDELFQQINMEIVDEGGVPIDPLTKKEKNKLAINKNREEVMAKFLDDRQVIEDLVERVLGTKEGKLPV